jgi:hypothetical protein
MVFSALLSRLWTTFFGKVDPFPSSAMIDGRYQKGVASPKERSKDSLFLFPNYRDGCMAVSP